MAREPRTHATWRRPISAHGRASFLTPEREAEEGRLLGLILAAGLTPFLPTLWSFVRTWSQSYHEHGFVVAGLVVWYLWKHRGALRGRPGDGIRELLPVVGALSLAWMVARAANVNVAQQILVVGVVAAWALASFGRHVVEHVAAATITFSLALPIWGVAVPVLRRATTVMSASIARLAGASAVIRGDTITVASGTFLVEAGCSGLNYLMAGLSLGAVYAHVFVAHWRTRLAVVAVAGAGAIVANWLRVAVLVLIGDAYGIESPLIEDHLWQGWAIFVCLMLPTYSAMRWVERRFGSADPQHTAAGPAGQPQSAARSSGFDPSRPRRAATAAGIAVIGPVAYLLIAAMPVRDPEPGPEPFGVADSGRLEQRSAAPGGWRPAFTGIDESSLWRLALPQGVVHADRYRFVDQRQGEELIQWSNAIAVDSLLVSERFIGPIGPRRLFLREAVVRDGEGPRLAWYWYRVAGVDTPFASTAKLLEIVAFLTRAPASELIVLSAACAVDSCVEAARAVRAAIEGEGTTRGRP